MLLQDVLLHAHDLSICPVRVMEPFSQLKIGAYLGWQSLAQIVTVR